MTHADLSVWGNACDEARSQPGSACGWKDHAMATCLLQGFFKAAVFPGMVQSVILQICSGTSLLLCGQTPVFPCCCVSGVTWISLSPPLQKQFPISYFGSQLGLTNLPLAEPLSCSAKIYTARLTHVLILQWVCSLTVGCAAILDSWSVAGTISQPKMPSAPTL